MSASLIIYQRYELVGVGTYGERSNVIPRELLHSVEILLKHFAV